MDSHVFRLISVELIRLLHGARVEKIHGPAPGVCVFTVFAHKAKRQLLLRHERQLPLLFFALHRLANPAKPPALVMRLRKYCAGRRLGKGIADFASRCIAFPVLGSVPGPAERQERAGGARVELTVKTASEQGGGGEKAEREEKAAQPRHEANVSQRDHLGPWLLLDLRSGPEVAVTLPQGFGAEPVWPPVTIVDDLCDRPWNKKEISGPWQDYAVLTPFLRESLAGMDVMEGRALLVDLEAGGGELFPYADSLGRLALYSAWPLPEEACRRRGGISLLGERPGCDLMLASGRSDVTALEQPAGQAEEADLSSTWHGFTHDEDFRREFPALFLVSCVDEPRFFAGLGNQADQEEKRPRHRESKRIAKLLAKLDQEEGRLRALAELRSDACRLREVLWQYPADARLDSVGVPTDPEGGSLRTIPLNGLLTVRENMERMFHSSARGARGLEHLKQRRAEVLGGLPESDTGGRAERLAKSASSLMPDGPEGSGRKAGTNGPGKENVAPASGGVLQEHGGNDRESGGAGRNPALTPFSGPRRILEPVCDAGRLNSRKTSGKKGEKDVVRFLSSDGFTLLRGKNAQGNQALLKLGQAHDFWLHALDGPSAHLIIRRSHAAEEIPETTLREAAVLVGEKSWQRHDAKARVMVALLRHVHAMKGAAPGTVKVDTVLRTLIVPLDGEGKTDQEEN